MASDTFSVGDITAIIGDNEAKDKHRAGYNGLWSLTHKSEKDQSLRAHRRRAQFRAHLRR